VFVVVDGQVSAVNEEESFVFVQGRDSAVNKKFFFIFVEGRGSVLYCLSSCNEFVDMCSQDLALIEESFVIVDEGLSSWRAGAPR